MKNYSSAITGQTQKQPLPGRNMTKNNAGGYGFEVSPQERLERFLLIGSEGGTYYVSEQKLTVDNADKIINLIKASGAQVVATVVNFAQNNRAPKADAGLFVLALCATFGDQSTKKLTYDAITKVCRTSTHLFTFISNINNLRGWSRGLRNAISKFYTTKTAEQVAYQLVKYRNRAGYTHRDVLRLAHPATDQVALSSLFGYAVGKRPASETGSDLVKAFEAAQTLTGKKLAKSIADAKLTWEMIPNEQLNNEYVLTALLQHMPLTALIRNLNRFSYNGMTTSNNATVKTIVSKLTDAEAVAKAGLHPVNVINSMMTYKQGRGEKGNKTWTANQNILDALQDTYELALKALTPTGKNILVGVDISGSMNTPVGGMSLACSQIANLLAVTILKSEKNAEMVWFDTGLSNPTLGRRSSVDTVLRESPCGGGTDCAQPFVHALKTKTKYDAIIILTDSETWAGPRHGVELLDQYRRQINRDVKVIEVAMTATGNSTMPDNDKNILRVVGFDASVTSVINNFIGE